MPKGRVEWFDPHRGGGIIVHSGRAYIVYAGDIERAAMVGGAPVRFDIRRQPDGDLAVNVELRRGTRSSPGQHRFGDQTGAKYPAEKHPLRNRPERDPKAPRDHPFPK